MAAMLRSNTKFTNVVAKSATKNTTAARPKTVCKAGKKVMVTSAEKVRTPTNVTPENDLMIRVAKGEATEATPVWLFRQAGRHLPEYNQFKKDSGKNFLQILDDPMAVAEVTMQPLRRYNLDAAILFSDILVVPQAFGIDVEMPGGKGILIPNPLTTPADLKRLPDSVDVEKSLGHVFEGVERINEAIVKEGHGVPLIGFSAAPWTLLYYMVGGSSKDNGDAGIRWCRDYPEDAQMLLDHLTSVVIDYLDKQVQCGAHMIQVFEAMGEFIDEPTFHNFAMPAMKKIAEEMRRRHPTIPLLTFPRDAMYGISACAECYDVVTIDTVASRTEMRAMIAKEAAARGAKPARLQGNFDPALLQLETGGTNAQIEDAVRLMLSEFGPQGLIANLGAGLMGKEDPARVTHMIDSVHSISKEMIAEGN
uniref:Uroporphyrinogen decarboxylase n=1 Tax=Pyramimonas obovata TaxID=1411642 RepID=A0A7S0QZV9_9CHLO|mmetsp:Transcript_20318/g.44473  ORF Transcript_20318/g.44473 Transcript_20318/m.44473 type:complete len:421 (+) Transcript_20318:79-1341(+)|eukprot:CAMPEP_0118932448 /NCGR_PEP_ID=MMETSP1169-20130426/10260_1 /TAXON_ID=36882 /ORGANISM="Pyramimonas obovata, Strain CCMP722" /LENGTH=420 /DNA_ID=CAMNT_0006875109 /DNA_START=79 /DNA_END=1341 /DNA_ORIENTATION=+